MNAKLQDRAGRIWELSNTVHSTENADCLPEGVKTKIVNRAHAGLRRLRVDCAALSWDDAVRLASQI